MKIIKRLWNHYVTAVAAQFTYPYPNYPEVYKNVLINHISNLENLEL